MSGDIDILISHPTRPCNILPQLVEALHRIGLLTDDLTGVDDGKDTVGLLLCCLCTTLALECV